MFCVLTLSESTGMRIACESVRSEKYFYLDRQKTCSIPNTAINSDDTTVAKAGSVTAISFNGNKKVKFLPVEVAFTFPNLVYYSALNCSIKVILKKHFKDLKKLKILILSENQIEIIRKDVFEDLRLLEFIDLGRKSFLKLNFFF